MSTCTHCLKALQLWHYGGFSNTCPACQIRQIAGSPKHIRDGAYDQALKLHGPAALAEIKESVRLEYARITQLKGRTK